MAENSSFSVQRRAVSKYKEIYNIARQLRQAESVLLLLKTFLSAEDLQKFEVETAEWKKIEDAWHRQGAYEGAKLNSDNNAQ